MEVSDEIAREMLEANTTQVLNDDLRRAVGDANGFALVARSDKFSMHSMEDYMPTRARARGAMTTSDMASWSDYLEARCTGSFSITSTFINPDDMNACGILNFEIEGKPGHCDDLAHLKLRPTAEYQGLRAAAKGVALTQRALAEFIEDYSMCFDGCYAGDDLDEKVSTKQAISAIRNITVEALRRVEAVEGQLSASKSTFEQVQADSKSQPIPTLLYFRCVPFAGLDSRLFVLRLSVLTSDDRPALVLRIVNPEIHQQEMAAEFADKIRRLPFFMGDGVVAEARRDNLFVGVYSRSK